jgi:hypothetical protein
MIIIRVSLLLKVETEDDELYMWSDDSEWINFGEEIKRILERKVKQSKGGWVNAHTHTLTLQLHEWRRSSCVV